MIFFIQISLLYYEFVLARKIYMKMFVDVEIKKEKKGKKELNHIEPPIVCFFSFFFFLTPFF